MQREGFTFIFPKVTGESPAVPEIRRDAPRRHRSYPFTHVTVPLAEDRFLRFFTTLTDDELVQRATEKHIQLCYRHPWGPLRCVDGR
jgi:hypothetical protein